VRIGPGGAHDDIEDGFGKRRIAGVRLEGGYPDGCAAAWMRSTGRSSMPRD